MNMDILEAKLMEFHPAIYKSGSGAKALRGVRYLTKDMESCEGDIVYVAAEDGINWGDMPRGLKNLIYCGKLKQGSRRNGEIYCIHITEASPMEEIFEKVLDAFEDEKRYESGTELLLRSNLSPFRESLDIEQIADIIYELLDNPFFICNTEGILICGRNDFNGNRQAEEIGMILSGEKQLGDAGDFEEKRKIMENSPRPVVFEEALGQKIKNAVVKIMIDHTVAAWLLLLEHNRKFQETDLVLLYLISNWLSCELKDSTVFRTPERSSIVHFIAELMQNNLENHREIRTRAEYLKTGTKKYHFVLAVDHKDMELKIRLPHAVAEELERGLPGSCAVLFQEGIALYINTDEKEYFSDERKIFLEKLCDVYHLKIGISYCYKDLCDTADAYTQAKTAVCLGGILRKKYQAYDYAEFSLYHWMQYIDTEDVTLFCHPKLLELLEYDREHHTEYVYTVYVFILCNGKQVVAAKELNIHRSTMIYRMEKIAQLTDGMDLYDTYTVTRLYLSYGILLLNGILDSERYNKI